MSAASTVPPLPDPLELLERSAWIGEVPGLRDETARWLRDLPARRARLARHAARLASPVPDAAAVRAIARTGLRTARLAAPEALTELLRAGAASVGLARRRSVERSGTAVRRAEQLVRAGGPAYVKLGQFIATAEGILPREWVEAFGWCRDEVPALPPDVARSVVRRGLGRPVRDTFRHLERHPFAAASIGQVHDAVLADGTEVVVKVRRPRLYRRFSRDIRAMAVAAAAAERLSAGARAANLSGFVSLFAGLVLEELDFRLESLNMVQLGMASEDAGHHFVRYPRPIPGLVAPNVLVMERVPGIRYTDASGRYPDLDGDRLLRVAITGVLEQLLIYGVFHGDLHAGNVLVTPDSTFSLVDFGIVGRIDAEQRAALVRFLVAFAGMDVAAMLDAMTAFGAIPRGVDLAAVTAELQARADAVPSGTVRFDELADVLGEVIRILVGNGFRLPSELVLFFKNLLYLNGLAAAVAPDADLLREIEPVFGYFNDRYADQMASILTGARSGRPG